MNATVLFSCHRPGFLGQISLLDALFPPDLQLLQLLVKGIIDQCSYVYYIITSVVLYRILLRRVSLHGHRSLSYPQ